LTCNNVSIATETINANTDSAVYGNLQGCYTILPAVSNQCSGTISGPAPTLSDACAGTITGTTTDPLTYTAEGDHIVTWSFNDGHGNTTTLTQHVIISDTTAPVPNISSLAPLSNPCTVTAIAPTATDNCAGTIVATTTNPLVYDYPGTYTITWTYNDGRGNMV